MRDDETIGSGTDSSARSRVGMSRRQIIATSVAALSGWSLMPAAARSDQPNRPAGSTGSDEETGNRLARAYELRMKAARHARELGAAEHPTNGDEALPGHLATFTKGLPHDKVGLVDPKAYAVLARALATGDPHAFESIPLGGFVKLANPQASWAYDLVGVDASQLGMPPPPSFSSAEQAGELVELYWHALLRDVPFSAWDGSPLVARACEDLSALSEFHGPKEAGRVTPATLFRGPSAGMLTGPYLSQFLLQELPLLPVEIEQRIRTAASGKDYLTDEESWLAVQNGGLTGVNEFDEERRFIRGGRDLGEYVHRDLTYQAYLGACLMALRVGAMPDGGNPYKHSRTQAPFTTFGPPFFIYLLAVVTQVALKTTWYEKWRVHRRLRPEEMGGRVQTHLAGKASFPIHRELLDSAALEETRKRQGSALLPQAFPEGCPTHPSYPAAHAVIAGACATVLKACLDEKHVIPGPVVAAADGLSLEPWKGEPLTVGGELDKLAANIAIGRNLAGVHWRSDGVEGLRLGEAVAIELLSEVTLTGNEMFEGFSLQRFDGKRVSVG